MFKQILVPVDGSSYAERAIDLAIELAQSLTASMALITVVRGAPDASSQGHERLMRTYLAEQAAAARARGVETVEILVPHEDPAAAIAEAARDWRADVIVMGTLGLGADQGHAVGSVALRALTTVPCPILMLRTDRPAPPRTPAEQRWQEEGGGNIG